MRRFITSLAVLGCAAWPVLAQSAAVTVTHDDPDGLVEPGQMVRITAMLEWSGACQLAGIAGSLRSSGSVGVASGPTTGLPGASGGLVNPGTPVGGSVEGLDVASIPPFFLGGLTVPVWSASPVMLLEFDWTAPATAVGSVEFDFVPSLLAPSARVYPVITSPGWIDVPTTYVATSIVVVPSPAGVVGIGCGVWIGVGGRRRR